VRLTVIFVIPGIGAGICYRLGEAGANIVMADIDAEANSETAKELSKMGFKTISVPGDIRVESYRDAVIDAAVKEFGGVDILVNNAGCYPKTPFIEENEAHIDQVFDLNVKEQMFTVL